MARKRKQSDEDIHEAFMTYMRGLYAGVRCPYCNNHLEAVETTPPANKSIPARCGDSSFGVIGLCDECGYEREPILDLEREDDGSVEGKWSA